MRREHADVPAEYIPKHDFIEWFEAARLTDVMISNRASNSWRGFGIAAA